MENLAKEWEHALSTVTKGLKALKRYVAEDNSNLVQEKYDNLKRTFQTYEDIHTTYIDQLVIGRKKRKDIEASELVYDDILETYTEVMSKTQGYLKRSEVTTPAPSQPESRPIIRQPFALPPAPQPEVFSGSPQHYPMWKASFSTLIERGELGLTGEQKMFYLQKYTTGEASRAIQSLFLVPSSESYISAMNILHERFGSSALVASAFREKLDRWPKIPERDSKALLSLSDFLQQIVVASTKYPSLEILNDEFENRKLVSKLPNWLAAKWIEEVVKVDSFPTFSAFSTFIKERAKIANHSLWDSRATPRPSQGQPHPRERTILLTSEGGNSSKTEQPKQRAACPLCQEGHSIHQCTRFKGQSLRERKETIMRLRLCFGCLNRGHQKAQCRKRQECSVCKLQHPTLLHDHQRQPLVDNNVRSYTTSNCKYSDSRDTCMTTIVPVKLTNRDASIVCYALLDSQSNSHFISEKVKRALGMKGVSSTVQLSTMLGKHTAPIEVVENVTLSSLESNFQVSLQRCFVKDDIPCSRDTIPSKQVVRNWPHLEHVPLHECKDLEVGLLLGYTAHEAFKPLELAVGGPGEPYGIRTPLGWCVMGPTSNANITSHAVRRNVVLRTTCKEIFLNRQDPLPLLDEICPSVEDRQFLGILDEGLQQDKEGNYTAPLPLRDNISLLPNNKVAAFQRLKGLGSKLQRDPELKSKYVEVMEENISQGFAERVAGKELRAKDAWYIPHHGVPKGKEGVRIVFDCSARYGGMSLNDCLLPGPNLINTLLGILLRFRVHPVAFTCDIQNMYYNFYVAPQHRDYLRFLWWPGGDMARDPVEYRMKVHIFGAISSGGVASYGLRKMVESSGAGVSDRVRDFVCKDFYVDDGCVSVPSDSEALSLLQETQSLLSNGNLRVHKVVSNSKALLDSLPDDDKVPPTDDGIHKVLGIEWNTTKDELMIPLSCKPVASRRGMLSVIASIYDPIGLVSPILIDARLLLQSISSESWDSPLSEDVAKKFLVWCSTLQKRGKVKVPRHIQPSFKVASVEMHYFSDASTTAYAACCYARFRGTNGETSLSFVIGKCKVVPLKPVLTVPRLELMACVLSTQLAMVVRRELHWSAREFFWTDSNVALGYIRNITARHKIFVANRVQTIHDRTDVKCWLHVGTKENPADDGSRGKQTSRWLDGPEFLRDHAFEPELTDPPPPEALCMSTGGVEAMKIRCFKSWFSTKKVYAWALRFINNCKPGSEKQGGDLSVAELCSAESCLFRLSQVRFFSEEIDCASARRAIPPSSPLFKLDCFLDEGRILRVGGRLRQSAFSTQEIHPVVLSPQAEITSLIIDHFHRKVKHQGRGMIMSEIRSSGIWIVRLANIVKSVIQKCVTCQRLRGKPIQQKMSDLPPDRLSTEPAFTNVGCDCFGPFMVKNGRSRVKRYGLMFTCLASRAVHIEMCHSLSTDSFINAYKRFVSIRGPVSLLRCDRGTNFVGARDDLIKMGCQVEFNPPDSSHRGGVWERMIGISRRVIEGILIEHGEQLDDESLLTTLYEAAGIVNSRPLCSVGSDPSDLVPLSANQLLTMKRMVVVPPPACIEVKADRYAVKRWKRVQYLAGLFWSRWKREFLTQYQQRSKWHKERENLRENDIVLIVDDQAHRSFWKMARVLEVKLSKDDLVRSVVLVQADGTKLERAVQKLVFLMHS